MSVIRALLCFFAMGMAESPQETLARMRSAVSKRNWGVVLNQISQFSFTPGSEISSEAHFLAALAYYQLGRSQQALESVNRAMGGASSLDTRRKALLLKAKILKSLGEGEECAALLDQLRRDFPGSLESFGAYRELERGI